MLDREPFLKAIFAEPDSDLPRLVFADWLDDRGETKWAELIRLQCEVARRTADDAGTSDAFELVVGRLQQLNTGMPLGGAGHRGFLVDDTIRVATARLADPDGFRLLACAENPHWYGATAFKADSGPVLDQRAVGTLMTSPVTEHVTVIDLAGREEQLGSAHDDALGMGLIDFVYRPVVGTRAVEHLCGLREARRLVALDLSRNDLDNDAVRALVRSTNLIRLRALAVMDGNTRVKGRLWGELQQRFGPEVVT